VLPSQRTTPHSFPPLERIAPTPFEEGYYIDGLKHAKHRLAPAQGVSQATSPNHVLRFLQSTKAGITKNELTDEDLFDAIGLR
jgi:hypothetical protein